jgi:hypothetical protein
VLSAWSVAGYHGRHSGSVFAGRDSTTEIASRMTGPKECGGPPMFASFTDAPTDRAAGIVPVDCFNVVQESHGTIAFARFSAHCSVQA